VEEVMNCWEFMKCGREAGGSNVFKMGVCLAYPNDGKQCARVAGTVCGGEVQGTFAMKVFDCVKCDFYKSKYYQHTNLNPQIIVTCKGVNRSSEVCLSVGQNIKKK
jgi:hypothetical protein